VLYMKTGLEKSARTVKFFKARQGKRLSHKAKERGKRWDKACIMEEGAAKKAGRMQQIPGGCILILQRLKFRERVSLEERIENKRRYVPSGGKSQKRLSPHREKTIQDRLPDIAEYDASDQIRHKKDRAEDPGSPDPSCQSQGHGKGQHIDQYA
jgi:hypothetical protein